MKLKSQNTIFKILFIINIVTRCIMFITLLMKFVLLIVMFS
jgi:hypothetical protein